MENWEHDWAGCLCKRMVPSVLEQGQNCRMSAREVLGLERVLQTAACTASFARSPGQMPNSFQELGVAVLKQQGLSYNDLNHLFRRSINGICMTPDILLTFLLEDLSPHFENTNKSTSIQIAGFK